jgi:hypothetical protein
MALMSRMEKTVLFLSGHQGLPRAIIGYGEPSGASGGKDGPGVGGGHEGTPPKSLEDSPQ